MLRRTLAAVLFASVLAGAPAATAAPMGELQHVQVGDTKPVHAAITYITNHHTRMNYAAARAAGLPIGSGNTEATCKTLVEVRMKRAGSRWKVDTGRHVLQLRARATSDRWDDGVKLTLQPLRKSVRVAA